MISFNSSLSSLDDTIHCKKVIENVSDSNIGPHVDDDGAYTAIGDV